MSDFKRCTLDDVSSALEMLVPRANERDFWVRMGMAIKSEFGDEGFNAWDAWSQLANNYEKKSAVNTWKSFKRSGGITIATLFKAAIDAGWRVNRGALTLGENHERDKERERLKIKREQDWASEQAATMRWHGVIADVACKVWGMLEPLGNSPYLTRKKIQSCGCRFVAKGIVVEFRNDGFKANIHSGQAEIDSFFQRKTKETSYRYLKAGCAIVPLCDAMGMPWNLQIIYQDGKKSFFKHGRKRGLSYVIGNVSALAPVIFVEGYATGASVYMATGYPVVVCFDAGNLPVVAREVRNNHPDLQLVFAGDNDVYTEGNPGLTKAVEAANDVGGVAVVPDFQEVVNG